MRFLYSLQVKKIVSERKSFGGEKTPFQQPLNLVEPNLYLQPCFPTKYMYWASIGTVDLIDLCEV